MPHAVARMLALVLLIAAGPVAAFHRKTPQLLQVTSHSTGTIAHPRWSGFRYVVFDSDADLLGNGNQTRQVFLFDLQERDLTDTPAIYQVTSGNGDSQRGDTGIRGRTIVYDTRPGDAGPRQIHAVDRGNGATRAITQGAADSTNPDVDDSGRIVVFESKADLLANGLAGTQIYRVDLRVADSACPYPCPANGNLGLTRVTNKAGTSRNAVTSKTGKTIVFESDADLLNTGAIGTQIYLFDVRLGTLARISFGPGSSHNPTLSRNGRLVAFESDDGAGGTQIVLYRRALGTSEQVTSATGTQSTRPSMEATGRGMIFTSTGDLLGIGSSGPQVFRYDVPAGTLSQVTDAPSTTSDPSHSAGVFVTFLADGDLLGNGSTNVELYLVNLFALGSARVP